MSEHAAALEKANREKRLVALSSVAAAVVLTSMKIVVGVSTGSLGVLSEAAHSALDLVAAGMTFWAVRASARPADREHTYGHGKFENLSALGETVLLLVTCVWIIYEAISRLFFRAAHVDPSAWAFATMGVSIVIDVSRSTALRRVARKYHSQALEADALHFSTDVWSSAVVIAGLVLVRVSQSTGITWLGNADAVAALGVAGIVVWVSAQLGKKSIDDLLDSVPSGLQAQALHAAHVPGVLEVRQARLRRSGPQVFADLTLAVGRDAAFERAHDVATDAEQAVRAALPGADVVVHVEPVSVADEDLVTTIRLLAARRGHGAHAIRIYDRGGRRAVELHLEVDERLSLDAAHDEASAFEGQLREAAPEVAAVTTHIEPAGVHSAIRGGELASDEMVRAALEALGRDPTLRFDAHRLLVRRIGGELDVSFHCALEGRTSITDAHSLTERLEKELRTRVPGLARVVIHVEPHDAHDDGEESV